MFPVISSLKYSRLSSYGKNLLHSPCRIISPYSNTIIEDNYINHSISYTQPNGNCSNIICKTSILVPEPYCYLQGNNTFLQSFLCLVHKTYIDSIHLPKKASYMMKEYCKTMCSSFTTNKKYQKCIQKIMYDKELITDPYNNIYFSQLCKMLFSYNNCECIIVRSDENGNFLYTIPARIPRNNTLCIILHQNYTGKFSPYGILKND